MNPPRRQLGLSLIELMIALLIGLVITAGVSRIFLSGKRSYNTQSGLGRLQENGRFALYFLQRDLRATGFPQIRGPGNSTGLAAPIDASQTSDGGAGSDEITTWWNPDAQVAGSDLDCLGQESAEIPVTSDYYVQAGNLMCRGSGNPDSPQPLIAGVESLQLQYGADDDADGVADRYVRADQVTNWNAVVAVRVAILVNSGEITREEVDAGPYAVLDAPAVVPADDPSTPLDERLYARRVFTTTVEIRNRAS